MTRILFFILFVLFFRVNAQQKPAFWQEIQTFRKQDSIYPPVQNTILFLGSSSFTKWTDISNYFPGKVIINRGFGGSRLVDLNYYSDILLRSYLPKQVVVYCGENDLAADDQPSPVIVLQRFKEFYKNVRAIYPYINISYVSIKYSPSRKHLWKKIASTNSLIKKYLDKKKNAAFVDITRSMALPNKIVDNRLFLEDSLHMNSHGYQLWAKAITPYLK